MTYVPHRVVLGFSLIVKLLVDAGAPKGGKNKQGKTPVDLAYSPAIALLIT